MMSRRSFLATSAAVGAGLIVAPNSSAADSKEPFTLPPLPYAYDALEPYIDAKTMEIHHDKHHAAYVAKLNAAVAGTPWASKSADELVADWEDLPESIQAAVRNNGGGHVNHTLFWKVLGPGAKKPGGDLAKAIDKDLGGYDALVAALSNAANTQFGSGWGWVAYDPEKSSLVVKSSPNQDNPLTDGLIPVLGVDVWEHAYYLKYQNRRPDYVKAFFEVVNWDAVGEYYDAAVRA